MWVSKHATHLSAVSIVKDLKVYERDEAYERVILVDCSSGGLPNASGQGFNITEKWRVVRVQ